MRKSGDRVKGVGTAREGESGRKGERENGRMGEWENGRFRDLGTVRV